MKKLLIILPILLMLAGCSVDKIVLQELKNGICEMTCKGVIEFTGGCYITNGREDELLCYTNCIKHGGNLNTGTVKVLKKDCID